MKNTRKILKPGGLFRCIIPDLECYVRQYLQEYEAGDNTASIRFIGDYTRLGTESYEPGIKGLFRRIFGHTSHLWMWDKRSFTEELRSAGFINIRLCNFGDSPEPIFAHVEEEWRYINAIAFECEK